MKKRTKQKLPLLERVKMAHEAIDYQLRTKKFGKNLSNEKLESIRIRLKNIEEKYVDKHLRAVKTRKDIIKDVNYVLKRGGKKDLIEKSEKELIESYYGDMKLSTAYDEEKVADILFAKKQAEHLLSQLTDEEKEEFLTNDFGSKLPENDFYTKYESDLTRMLEDYKQDLLVISLLNYMKEKEKFKEIGKLDFKRGDKNLENLKKQVEEQMYAKYKNRAIEKWNAHIAFLKATGREKEAQDIINARTAKAVATRAKNKAKKKKRG